MRAEGSSCSVDVLYGGLGISKLQFLIKNKKKKNFHMYFLQFLVIIKTLDPDLDPDSLGMLDPDPQHWFLRHPFDNLFSAYPFSLLLISPPSCTISLQSLFPLFYFCHHLLSLSPDFLENGFIVSHVSALFSLC